MHPEKQKKKALFIDRDGTINHDCPYCHQVSQLKLYEDIAPLIKKYKDSGYLVIVITNQSGIGRGYFSKEECDNFNNAIRSELDKRGAKIDAFYYCPHKPENNCNCRKPKTELVAKAVKDFNIDLTNSIVIGDRDDIDGEMARKLNVKYTILDRTL